jgi:CubicO group peptidase (beta-lactamase class C family)
MATNGNTAIDEDRLDALRTRIRQEIDDGILPSCSYAVGLDGEVVVSETFGARDRRHALHRLQLHQGVRRRCHVAADR